MAVEDIIRQVKEAADRIIPEHVRITKVTVEASSVVLYTPEIKIFAENNDLVRKLAHSVRKRIIIRPDPTALADLETAKKTINSIIPEDAGITDIHFDPELGEVTIVATNPGLAIGKYGKVLNQIKCEIGWVPKVERLPPIDSKTVTDIRRYLRSIASERKDFLEKIGRRIFRSTLKGEDFVRVTALGGYREVGRSCHLLSTKDSRVIIDCGINPSSDVNSSPFLQAPEALPLENIDALVITHAHLDHAGLAPMLFVYGFDGPIYCTPPTRDMMSLLQLDYLKVTLAEGRKPPYGSEHVRKAVRNAIAINYKESTDIAPDIKLTLQNAGHILGSCSAHFNVGEGLYNIAFSGDIKFENTWLFDKAVNNFPRLEAMILEATYGGARDFQPSREEATNKLLEIIDRTIERKGRILIPVFAVGRSQEVMLVLEAAMRKGRLPQLPVYLDGMIWEATALHSAYPEYLNNNLRNKIFQTGANPFQSEFFAKVDSQEMRQEVCSSEQPCIVLATSGMLNGGPVMEYLRNWAPDEQNTMVFVGYQAKGTLGSKIQRGWQDIHLSDHKGKSAQVKINMHIETSEGFSGHSDKRQLMRFARTLKPRPELLLINHGDEGTVQRLAKDIFKKTRLETRAPKNLETIRMR